MILEATYAARAAAGREDERLRAYARWTLTGGRPRLSDAASCVADRVLRRAALVPAPARLEAALAARLGPRLQAGLRRAFQLQYAALRHGAWRAAATDLAELGELSGEEAELALRLALEDLSALWRAASAVYPVEPEAGPLFVSFTGRARPGWETVFVEDGGEGPWAPFERPDELEPAEPSAAALREVLRRCFGHAAFRPGQEEALTALLAGRDAAALLPTAAGKSLIAHMAALLRPGLGVVIEPLLSVVADQRRALAERGITRACAAEDFDAERALLAFLSPERLDSAVWRERLAGASFVCVDEAHCVTPWGHDFRPALLSVGRRARRWTGAPLLALTGTATEKQLAQACAALSLSNPQVVAAPQARPELRFATERVARAGHLPRLRAWIAREARFGPGLVFCPTVEGAAAAREALTLGENVAAGLFTGRAPREEDPASWDEAKAATARRFLAGRLDWLCCTRAFGMGVDVPRARCVAHLGLAGSLEGYLQEAGRAGRDGRAALCLTLLHVEDERRALAFFELDAEALARVPRRGRDDAWAALMLHHRAYPGLAAERLDARLAARALGPLREGALAALSMAGQAERPLARFAARLEEAGLVELWQRRPDALVLLARRDATIGDCEGAASAEAERVYREIEPARRASMKALLERLLEARQLAVQPLVLDDGLVPR